MADRQWYPEEGNNGHKRARLNFSFNTNNTANPLTSLIYGAGDVVSTITLTNTGEYTVTLSPRDHYNRVLGVRADIEDTQTGAGTRAQAGFCQNEGTGSALTFKVFTYNSSNALANVVNTRIFIELVVRNTAAAGIP